MFSNRFAYLFLFVITAFVVYRVASGKPSIIENWGWTMVPMNVKSDIVTPSGQSQNLNNQSQLYYNNNQLINTSLLNHPQRQLLSETLQNPMSTTLQGGVVAPMGKDKLPPSLITNYDISENYQQNSNYPVYTVPGTYQADLSPRFNPNGLNSYVKYNVPKEEYLASRSNDPLMMKKSDPLHYANLVEKQTMKEDFTSCSSANSADEAEMKQKLMDQGSEILSKLPVTPMNQASGNEKPDIYYNTDRYLFALQKSRLYGLGDFIRGDIPVVPCNPSRNPYSNTWFRPSVTPRYDLNAGAMGVIGGVGNVSNQQTLELMARSVGGAGGVINGVSAQPTDTPVYNLQAIQNSQYKTYNMGNSFEQTVDAINPPSTVITTAFP